jgi:hypothetical protein
VKLVLYSDDPYSWEAWDEQGGKWQQFFGDDLYAFTCSVCGHRKFSGWQNARTRRQVCQEDVMLVYDMSRVLAQV